LIQHLLLALDRRTGSYRTAALGMRLAWCFGARVTVLFIVAPPLPGATRSDEPHSHEAVDIGERVFRRVRRMAAAAGVPCVCRYAFGNDAQMIVSEAATTHQCDLIVLNAP
jgi:nucleotide-binding universal stress UspA family protein